jgi:hypothetical protein
MVRRTRLKFTLYEHCLPWLILKTGVIVATAVITELSKVMVVCSNNIFWPQSRTDIIYVTKCYLGRRPIVFK